MPFKRGEVVLAIVPLLEPPNRKAALCPHRSGQKSWERTHLACPRPASNLTRVIMAMITSNVAAAGRPRRVLMKRSDKDARDAGQLADSVVMTDNLATLLENEVDRSIGKWR
jgi:mRNA interferase MazF